MFTSNGEIHCKLFSSVPDNGIVEMVGSYSDPNRGYGEDYIRRARARTRQSAQPINDGRFDRRLPPQSNGHVKLREPEKEQDQDQRKVHFRHGARNMYGKFAHNLNSGTRNGGAYDEESSVSSDGGYGGPTRFTKMPPNYLRTQVGTQIELKTPPKLTTPPDEKTPPELKTPPGLKSPPKFKSLPEFLTPPELKTLPKFVPSPGIPQTPPEFVKSHSYGDRQSHGNQLLNLRAALSEKELQLVELREQHLNVLNRAADARQNWEEALQSKDRVILQLQRKLEHKGSQLERQERENQENLYELRKVQEEITDVEKIEHKVALLEAKNAQFVQELVEQQTLITRMKRHIEEQEKLSGHQCRKLEKMNGKVQDLKAALQEKEEVVDTQYKYNSELKTLLWKRDTIIAELQLSEQQLQSVLAREKADREALLVSREKVEEEKALIEKTLSEMQNQRKTVGNDASHNAHLQRGHRQSAMRKLAEMKDDFSNIQEGVLKDVDDKEGVMHRMQKRIRELQRSLKSKDSALSERNVEYQQALQDFRRLTEDYEALKQEYEDVNKRNFELENTVAHFRECSDGQMDASISEVWTPPVEVLPYDCSLGESTGEDLAVDDTMLDSMEFESEQLSNASVYHANFEKIKISEVEMPDIDPQQQHQQQQQQQQQHQQQQQLPQPPITTHQPLHPSFPPPPPPGTPLPPSAPTSPRRPPLCAELPPRSSRPPSAGPSDKNCDDHSSEFEAKHNSIQDEIMKREQSWRKTEELMRAALTRRMKLLEHARDVKMAKTDVTRPAKAGSSELHDRLGYGHSHHLHAELSMRGNADHKATLKEGNRIQLGRKPTDDVNRGNDGNGLNHVAIPRQMVHGYKYHGHDGASRQRKAHEQDIYQDCRFNIHSVGHLKKVDAKNRRQREPDLLPDRRMKVLEKNTSHLEDCITARSDHYGHYERSTDHGRMSRHIRKGKIP